MRNRSYNCAVCGRPVGHPAVNKRKGHRTGCRLEVEEDPADRDRHEAATMGYPEHLDYEALILGEDEEW